MCVPRQRRATEGKNGSGEEQDGRELDRTLSLPILYLRSEVVHIFRPVGGGGGGVGFVSRTPGGTGAGRYSVTGYTEIDLY